MPAPSGSPSYGSAVPLVGQRLRQFNIIPYVKPYVTTYVLLCAIPYVIPYVITHVILYAITYIVQANAATTFTTAFVVGV